MKRSSLTGLGLVAMVAFVAMATALAYAGEYGVCLKTDNHTGKWNNGRCTKGPNTEKRGRFEWWPGRTGIGQPGVTAEDFEYPNPEPEALKKAEKLGGPSELWSKFTTVICRNNIPEGDVLGAQYNVDRIKFTRCTIKGTKTQCTGVGDRTGEIVWFTSTYLLDHGTYGPSGRQPLEGEVWNTYFASEGAPYYPYLAIFECAGAMVRYSGHISGVVTPDSKMTTARKVSFAENIGEQDLVTEYSENGGETWQVTGTYSIRLRSYYTTKDRSSIEIRACNDIGAVSEGKGAPPCESEEPLPW
ncbi:MAG: hypothetical protein ACLQBY_15420 [Solirubrobacteraceae bacterium]